MGFGLTLYDCEERLSGGTEDCLELLDGTGGGVVAILAFAASSAAKAL
jgi:hypothetical protein